MTIYNQLGTKLVNADTLALQQPIHLRRGENQVGVRLDRLHLNPGVYRLGLGLADPVSGRTAAGAYDYIESAFEIEVRAGPRGSRSTDAIVSCDFSVAEIKLPTP